MKNLLDKLQRKLHGRSIPNLMLYIVLGMLAVFMLNLMRPSLGLYHRLALDMPAIMRGEVWRLVTFLFLPPSTSILWLFFSLYFYYLIGSALENQWGSFRFNVFYLVGAISCILSALITGYGTNAYLNLSLFFAFAFLYPDFQLLLFFVLPIKIKYLAILDGVLFLLSFVIGSWSTRFAILLALVNVALFFGKDAIDSFKMWKRRRDFKKNFR